MCTEGKKNEGENKWFVCLFVFAFCWVFFLLSLVSNSWESCLLPTCLSCTLKSHRRHLPQCLHFVAMCLFSCCLSVALSDPLPRATFFLSSMVRPKNKTQYFRSKGCGWVGEWVGRLVISSRACRAPFPLPSSTLLFVFYIFRCPCAAGATKIK